MKREIERRGLQRAGPEGAGRGGEGIGAHLDPPEKLEWQICNSLPQALLRRLHVARRQLGEGHLEKQLTGLGAGRPATSGRAGSAGSRGRAALNPSIVDRVGCRAVGAAGCPDALEGCLAAEGGHGGDSTLGDARRGALQLLGRPDGPRALADGDEVGPQQPALVALQELLQQPQQEDGQHEAMAATADTARGDDNGSDSRHRPADHGPRPAAAVRRGLAAGCAATFPAALLGP